MPYAFKSLAAMAGIESTAVASGIDSTIVAAGVDSTMVAAIVLKEAIASEPVLFDTEVPLEISFISERIVPLA